MTTTSAQALRIVSANLEEGGLDADGSRARWERTVEAIGAWSPDVVCFQEMAARRDRRRLRAHLWATANALGMFPLLGSEGGISGNRPAAPATTPPGARRCFSGTRTGRAPPNSRSAKATSWPPSPR